MGPLYCLLSATGFGAMAIFAKLAYAEGVQLDELLILRFGLAGALLLALAQARGLLTRLDRRTVAIGLAMGAIGYASQAGLYFAALTHVDASQVALVFGVYPLLVMAAACVTRRERASRRRVGALGTAICGIALVLGGGAAAAFDPAGALLALGSALIYTCYILVGDRVAADVPPLALAALVCAGGFATFAVSTVARGDSAPAFGLAGWSWVAVLVLVSTVAAILLFFAGLARVGPTVAALLSSVEPVVTVVAAAVVFGEPLTAGQVLGGVLVLSAVVVVQWPTGAGRRDTAVGSGPTSDAASARAQLAVGG